MSDSIRPEHYKVGRYEPKDVIRDWDLNFNKGNAIKYIARAGRKNDEIEDLQKAIQYLQFEIDYLRKSDSKDLEIPPKTISVSAATKPYRFPAYDVDGKRIELS
jgi:hypothetical protein